MVESDIRPDQKAIVDLIETRRHGPRSGLRPGRASGRAGQERKEVKGQGIEIDDEAILHCVALGLNVFHDDIDRGLSEYSDQSFDYVILNQTFQQVKKPDEVLQGSLRVGRRVIIGFPNFASLSTRYHLGVCGRTPVTPSLPYQWYDTPNLHFLSILDFIDYCKERKMQIVKAFYFAGHETNKHPSEPLCGYRRISHFKAGLGSVPTQRRHDVKYEALLTDFLNGPKELEKEVEGIERDLADYRPFEGAWTIREHVVHVTDSEINNFVRWKSIFGQPRSNAYVIDEEAWVKNMRYATASMDKYLKGAEASQGDNLRLPHRGRRRGMEQRVLRARFLGNRDAGEMHHHICKPYPFSHRACQTKKEALGRATLTWPEQRGERCRSRILPIPKRER